MVKLGEAQGTRKQKLESERGGENWKISSTKCEGNSGRRKGRDFGMFHVYCKPWTPPLIRKFPRPPSSIPHSSHDITFGKMSIQENIA